MGKLKPSGAHHSFSPFGMGSDVVGIGGFVEYPLVDCTSPFGLVYWWCCPHAPGTDDDTGCAAVVVIREQTQDRGGVCKQNTILNVWNGMISQLDRRRYINAGRSNQASGPGKTFRLLSRHVKGTALVQPFRSS